jgi:hypothetical protein
LVFLVASPQLQSGLGGIHHTGALDVTRLAVISVEQEGPANMDQMERREGGAADADRTWLSQ